MIPTKLLYLATIFLTSVVPLSATRIIDCKRCGLEHLLRSPAVGIDVSTDFLTSAIKYANGTVAPLAKFAASDELRTLMQGWAKDPIDASPESDWFLENKPLDRDPLTPEAEVLYESLVSLKNEVSAQHQEVDLQDQHNALSLPPFVHRRHSRHVQQAARKAGLMTAETGSIDHNDATTHMMYNALFCAYHVHPHDPLCSEGELLDRVLDALVIDYSASILSVTWHETHSWFSSRNGGFASGELGGRSLRDSQYWDAVRDHIAALLQSVDRVRVQDDRPPRSAARRNQLIFIGELGVDHLLRAVLRDVFAGTRFDFDNITIHDSVDSVFASAFSAAVIKKAFLDAPEPKNCFESRECKELRERVYEEELGRVPIREL